MLAAAVVLSALTASALDLSHYAAESVLGSGRWVKISVSETGIHMIPASDLRKWGFTDISRVRVHGYGGGRIGDVLSADNFIDDLPQQQIVATARGIYFYAVGPTSWTRATSGRFRPVQNPFTTVGYYYLTDSGDEQRQPADYESNPPSDGQFATTFVDRVCHERDLVSPGETGHLLLGEDFRYEKTRTFAFSLPDRDNAAKVWAEVSFMAKTTGGTSTIVMKANGTTLPRSSRDDIARTSTDSHYHGTSTTTQKEFDLEGEKLSFEITHKASTSVAAAYLNYISINYYRRLSLSGGKLLFTTSERLLRLSGVTDETRLWDVTDPCNIISVKPSVADGQASWAAMTSGQRDYVAWNESATYPRPTLAGNVSNQNIHATAETPDMVIVTLPEYASQAARVANLHRTSADSMKVVVVNADEVYNEFGSGSPDAGAIRKCLKMFYDRGEAAGHPLRYALLVGRPFYDNRRLTGTGKALRFPTLPSWQTDNGLNDNDSYSTDDYYSFLLDNSGANMGKDILAIAVGRLAVTSLSEARTVVDKLYTYVNSSPSGQWKNRVLMVADDEDYGQHLDQTEKMVAHMAAAGFGGKMTYSKVYLDSYVKSGSVYPGARTDMFRALDDGVVWWNFIGHANPTSWTHDGLMTYTDVNSLYLRRWPFVYAATCDFLRWDASTTSAAELLFSNPNGGVIGVVSATRPVYISENGYLSASIGKHLFDTDGDGLNLTVGEAIRRGKNGYDEGKGVVSNHNKLRYVFLGDPAMRLATPVNNAVVSSINGDDIDSYDPPVIKAAQDAVVEGYLADSDGNLMTDFSGVVETTVYDAETSVTTRANGEHGVESVYDQRGLRLYAGTDSVRHGRFRLKVAMPVEISDNYRPAEMTLYARSGDGREAIGVNRAFYVYGYDDTAVPDTVAPVIEELYLNHSTFRNGDRVNESPVVIARLSDDRAINLSMAGIGHQMTMWLDTPSKVFTDVSLYYTPSADGTPSGTVAYPLENLVDGFHSLRFRVWDAAGNATEKSVDFIVEHGLPAVIFDVTTDANPASASANFYLSHNRPDAMVDVRLQIFDLMGRQVYTSVQSGRSDLFSSFPITWDLRDMSGRRVPRGIYLYRASVTGEDGTESNTVTKKIAVTSR